jgi:hypothetical protein
MSSLLANEFRPPDDHAAIREGIRYKYAISRASAGLDNNPIQNPTLSPPFSVRISRASSGVATSRPSPSMILRTCVT